MARAKKVWKIKNRQTPQICKEPAPPQPRGEIVTPQPRKEEMPENRYSEMVKNIEKVKIVDYSEPCEGGTSGGGDGTHSDPNDNSTGIKCNERSGSSGGVGCGGEGGDDEAVLREMIQTLEAERLFLGSVKKNPTQWYTPRKADDNDDGGGDKVSRK